MDKVPANSGSAKIPGWLGPVIAGAVYLVLCSRGTLQFSLGMLAGMLAMGVAAGVAIWLGDLLTRKKK
jgi:hypothetical protein